MRVSSVLVVVVDESNRLETEMIVEFDGLRVRRPYVAGGYVVSVIYHSNQSLPEPVSPVIRFDSEEEYVPVVSDRGESDQLFFTLVAEAVRSRVDVGVEEELALLMEYVTLFTDVFLQFPRLLDIASVAGVDNIYIDAYAHNSANPSNLLSYLSCSGY